MSIVSEFESLFASLRTKVGTLSTEVESHFSNFLGLAKDEEAAAEAKVQAEIAHLESLHYIVTKAPDAVIGAEPATTAVPAAPVAAEPAAPAA